MTGSVFPETSLSTLSQDLKDSLASLPDREIAVGVLSFQDQTRTERGLQVAEASRLEMIEYLSDHRSGSACRTAEGGCPS